DPERICTSIVERSNLSTRMAVRRFTRLTNGFSKKWENHWAAVAVWFAFYSFCRFHKSLRMAPAMAAESLITSGPCESYWKPHRIVPHVPKITHRQRDLGKTVFGLWDLEIAQQI